jgi:hypothetical protein
LLRAGSSFNTILRSVSARFHIDLGPQFDLKLDDSGIHFQRGPFTRSIPWDKITGASFIPPQASRDLQEEARPHDRDRKLHLEQFLGAEATAKIQEMRAKVGQVVVAYRNDRNHLETMSVPAPLDDPSILNEFISRLGPRWLGEAADERAAEKKLHTNPGFFKSVFILIVLFGGLALIAAIFFLGVLGPVLNLLSIQKMLLDFQDGNYASLASRVACYLALFLIVYFLHRAIRSKLDSLKGKSAANRYIRP